MKTLQNCWKGAVPAALAVAVVLLWLAAVRSDGTAAALELGLERTATEERPVAENPGDQYGNAYYRNCLLRRQNGDLGCGETCFWRECVRCRNICNMICNCDDCPDPVDGGGGGGSAYRAPVDDDAATGGAAVNIGYEEYSYPVVPVCPARPEYDYPAEPAEGEPASVRGSSPRGTRTVPTRTGPVIGVETPCEHYRDCPSNLKDQIVVKRTGLLENFGLAGNRSGHYHVGHGRNSEPKEVKQPFALTFVVEFDQDAHPEEGLTFPCEVRWRTSGSGSVRNMAYDSWYGDCRVGYSALGEQGFIAEVRPPISRGSSSAIRQREPSAAAGSTREYFGRWLWPTGSYKVELVLDPGSGREYVLARRSFNVVAHPGLDRDGNPLNPFPVQLDEFDYADPRCPDCRTCGCDSRYGCECDADDDCGCDCGGTCRCVSRCGDCVSWQWHGLGAVGSGREPRVYGAVINREYSRGIRGRSRYWYQDDPSEFSMAQDVQVLVDHHYGAASRCLDVKGVVSPVQRYVDDKTWGLDSINSRPYGWLAEPADNREPVSDRITPTPTPRPDIAGTASQRNERFAQCEAEFRKRLLALGPDSRASYSAVTRLFRQVRDGGQGCTQPRHPASWSTGRAWPAQPPSGAPAAEVALWKREVWNPTLSLSRQTPTCGARRTGVSKSSSDPAAVVMVHWNPGQQGAGWRAGGGRGRLYCSGGRCTTYDPAEIDGDSGGSYATLPSDGSGCWFYDYAKPELGWQTREGYAQGSEYHFGQQAGAIVAVPSLAGGSAPGAGHDHRSLTEFGRRIPERFLGFVDSRPAPHMLVERPVEDAYLGQDGRSGKLDPHRADNTTPWVDEAHQAMVQPMVERTLHKFSMAVNVDGETDLCGPPGISKWGVDSDGNEVNVRVQVCWMRYAGSRPLPAVMMDGKAVPHTVERVTGSHPLLPSDLQEQRFPVHRQYARYEPEPVGISQSGLQGTEAATDSFDAASCVDDDYCLDLLQCPHFDHRGMLRTSFTLQQYPQRVPESAGTVRVHWMEDQHGARFTHLLVYPSDARAPVGADAHVLDPDNPDAVALAGQREHDRALKLNSSDYRFAREGNRNVLYVDMPVVGPNTYNRQQAHGGGPVAVEEVRMPWVGYERISGGAQDGWLRYTAADGQTVALDPSLLANCRQVCPYLDPAAVGRQLTHRLGTDLSARYTRQTVVGLYEQCEYEPAIGSVQCEYVDDRQREGIEGQFDDLPYPYCPSPAGTVAVNQAGQCGARVTLPGQPRTMETYVVPSWRAGADTVSLTGECITGTAPRFGDTIDDQVWTKGIEIDELELPAATGGDGNLSYALTPELPSGVVRSGRSVTGTPARMFSRREFVWTATDQDGDAASVRFHVEVKPPSGGQRNTVPSFDGQTVGRQSWTVGRAIDTLTLPAATGGNGVLSYSLTPALPDGVVRNDRVVTGTPQSASTLRTYTWRATDSDGDYAAVRFQVEVVRQVPSFGGRDVRDQYWTAGAVIAALTLPAAAGGDTPLTYGLSPSLPAGVSRSGRSVTGTPRSAMSSRIYTWRATDSDGDLVELEFRIVVGAPSTTDDTEPEFADAVDDQLWTKGTDIGGLTLPAAAGGNGVLTYRLAPALPSGVSLTLSERELTGTPDAAVGWRSYSWTATDEDGDVATTQFRIRVSDGAADTQPTFGSATVGEQNWTVGQAVTALTLPAAAGGNGDLAYSLSPGLPDGVSRTGMRVSGVPQVALTRTQYTWTARDQDGDPASLTFWVTVTRLIPTFGTQTIPDQTWIAGTAIDTLTLPSAAGGDGTLTYTLSPALPDGVARDGHTVTGAPENAAAMKSYEWQAMDADGDFASLSFAITVSSAGSDPVSSGEGPSFGGQVIDDQQWRQGDAITELTLPEATGGAGPLVYALSPGLPAGVGWDDFAVNGTPETALPARSFTWRVTDRNSRSDRIDFRIAIASDTQPSFGSDRISGQIWTVGDEVSLILPSATGGDGGLTYTLSPALPDGVTRSGHTVSGAPGSVAAVEDYTWTATDADGDEASLRFTVEVVAGAADRQPTFGSERIPNQQWTAGTAIDALTLPTAAGGNGTLAYTLSPALPGGVTRSLFQVGGTPAKERSGRVYTWTATDEDGDYASLPFRIWVAAAVADRQPTFGAQSIQNQQWTVGTAIDALTLPAATGGDGTLTYTLSPALPGDVTRSGHTVRGTPGAAQARQVYTWTARDADGDPAVLTFRITVAAADRQPTFGAQTIQGQQWTAGTAIDALTLPAATGGDGSLTYTLSPALPDGIARTGRTVAGTPQAARTGRVYTWTARDADNDPAVLTFRIEVVAAVDRQPTFGAQTIRNQRWTAGTAIDTLTLPAATGGDGQLTYRLSPGLPSGVARTGHTVSGTPGTASSAKEYTWTATDVDGDNTSLLFRITVVAAAVDRQPTFGAQTISDQQWTAGAAIDTLTLPAATGGDGTLSYTLSPGLPSGVALSGHTVRGTPGAARAGRVYIWTARDADGDPAVLRFRVTVAAADRQPSFGAQTIANQQWTAGTVIRTLTLPTATGGDGTLTYSLSPALPHGVARTGRTVAGTPQSARAGRVYTWTARDADDDRAVLTFRIEVVATPVDRQPTFGGQRIDSQQWTAGTAIDTLTLPAATGGDGTLAYALSPSLPLGVTRSERTVSGTPGSAAAGKDYTWTATDEDGDFVSLSFRISVAAAVVDQQPTFGTQTIGNQQWTAGTPIDTLMLPSATGGDGQLTYTLSPALPGGVVRNGHTVTGTPDRPRARRMYTWTVRDADNDPAVLTFRITVGAADLTPEFDVDIDDQNWKIDESVGTVTLPAAAGGNGTLTYTLSPDLPEGVNRQGFEISGAPDEFLLGRTEFTWTAEDEDGDRDQRKFYIHVGCDGATCLMTLAIPSIHEMDVGRPFRQVLPAAVNPHGEVTYSLLLFEAGQPVDGMLPGLRLDGRTWSGTPEPGTGGDYFARWRACDQLGCVTTDGAQFTVSESQVPGFWN